MESYCIGVLQHVEKFAVNQIPTVSEILETRRQSIGMSPLYQLVEFACGLEIPDTVFSHPTIQTLEDLAAELVAL